MKKFILALLFFHTILSGQATTTGPRSQAGAPDSGKFFLYVRESVVGIIDYSLGADGAYQRTFTLDKAGQQAVFRLNIAVGADGAWQSMQMEVPGQNVSVQRQNDRAEFTAREQKYSVQLPTGHLPYDNYGPVFEQLMLRAYDPAKGGRQKFPRYAVPAAAVDFEMEKTTAEIRAVAGKEQEFQRYIISAFRLQLEAWVDGAGKLVLLHVPVQYASYVRQGYEELLPAGGEDPSLSKPQYRVERRAVSVPMRDGVQLAADLYLPQAQGRKFPVILIRTPYKKEMMEIEGNYYCRRGYAVVIQDCRGRFASHGVWKPFFHESRDGYDTIEWAAAQEWSSGKVGMIGGSYVGWVQLWAAAEKPPHLTTIIPNVAPPDPFFNIPYEYGVFFTLGAIWWADILESKATADISGQAMLRVNEKKYETILKSLPVIELDKKILGRENPYWREWIRHNRNDDFWRPANFLDKLSGLDIPVFLQSGWFDGDGIGSKLNYLELKKSRNPWQKLILGPWGHSDQSTATLGETDFGPQAAPDLKRLYLRWFDRWLKEIDNGIEKEPLVQLFVMFSNRWLSGDRYPLPGTQFTRFYLDSEKGANTSQGDGRVVTAAPQKEESADRYTYDPRDPTPSPNYFFLSAEEEKEQKGKTLDPAETKKKVQAFHEAVSRERRDILVYQSEPLTEPLTIAGPVSAVLYAASSAVDTDWFVTLSDVDEQGNIFSLCRGMLRARFRHSMKNPEPLTPNQVFPFQIDMWHTAVTFRQGHRIRVEVTSAMFPEFSRNLNTGGHNEMETKSLPARQTIRHDKTYPSHILLPVVKLPEEKQ